MYTAQELNKKIFKYSLWERFLIYWDVQRCIEKLNDEIKDTARKNINQKKLESTYYASIGMQIRPYNTEILKEKVEKYYENLGYDCCVLTKEGQQWVEIEIGW